MDKHFWKSAVLNVVERIADESYQSTAWFGVGDHVSSPEEFYCELFDDFIFNDFLSAEDIQLTANQRALGVKLKDKMNQYAGSVDYIADAKRVFNDSKWDEVRCSAREFLKAF